MNKFKSTLEAFLRNEIKRKDLTEQLEQLLQRNPNCYTQLLSDMTNWHETGKLPQEIYAILKFKIEQFNEINQANVTAIANNQTNQSINTNASIFQNDNNEEVVLKQGLIIRENYRLVEQLGEGGMGVVWKAVDLVQEEGDSRNPYVAIKFLSKNFKEHPDALKALVRELARYQRLNHPNIVRAYELSRVGGTVFMVMEFLDGISLKPFIKANPNGIPLEEAKPIIQDMGKALSYIHKEGIAHLDFKPDNVFYDPKDQIVKIIDFGIARLIKPSEREKTRYDPGNLSAYTEPYASSEMLLGLDPAPADDIYALACVTYELLSGKHPFNRKTATKAEAEKLSPKPIDGLTSQQNKTLLRALAFRREERTSTVENFLEELFPEKKKSSSLIVRGIIITLVCAVIFGSIVLWKTIEDENKRREEQIRQQAIELERFKQQDEARKRAEIERAKEKAEKKAEARRLVKEKKIRSLLEKCKTHLEAKRFTTGTQGTALDCYQQVLKLDPNNPDSKAGLKVMEDFYIEIIETALYKNQKYRAKKILPRLEKVDKNSAALDYFKRRLYPDYNPQQITIQKGAIGPGDDLEHGEKLFKQYCVICHGENGEGKAKTFSPRIQGQHYEYMLRQFKFIREGKGDRYPGMAEAIKDLTFTDRDIKAVADYTSRLKLTDL
jgi:serine/threonine protein kinase/cytochrome c553